jgi:transcriptional regulator with XRE-family HTH domain
MTGARDYQLFIVQAINAERAAQGLTAKALQEKSGIPDKTFRRAMACERDLDVAQLGKIADALGVLPSDLALEGERRRKRSTGRPDQDAALRVIADETT